MDDRVWNLSWGWKSPQNIRTFIWLVLPDRVKTKAELSRRNLNCDTTCNRCGCGLEDLLHAIRDCIVVRQVWNHFIPVTNRFYFYSLNMKDWTKYNLERDWSFESGLGWNTVFGVAIWRLWF